MTDQTLVFVDGAWHEGDIKLLSARSQATYQAALVFDGARAIDGHTPDLDRHCQRVVRSARALGLEPTHEPEAIVELCQEGIARFPKGESLYIRPTYHADQGFIAPDPSSTKFSLAIWKAALPEPGPRTVALAKQRRPSAEYAPTDAKAACLYPQAGLALIEAHKRGFTDALMLDPVGHVAEFGYSNVMIGKDGAVHTPIWNGCFLNGITRQRVIALLREAGIAVHERPIRFEEVLDADEVFATGNFAKLLPVTGVEDRAFQPGPLYATARELYWDWMYS